MVDSQNKKKTFFLKASQVKNLSSHSKILHGKLGLNKLFISTGNMDQSLFIAIKFKYLFIAQS